MPDCARDEKVNYLFEIYETDTFVGQRRSNDEFFIYFDLWQVFAQRKVWWERPPIGKGRYQLPESLELKYLSEKKVKYFKCPSCTEVISINTCFGTGSYIFLIL